MPITNNREAQAVVLGILKDAWASSTYASVPIVWDDIDEGDGPPDEGPWIEASVSFVAAPQRGFGGPDATKKRKFRVFGLLSIGVYTPRGEGRVDNMLMCDVLLRAYQTAPTNGDAIQFRNIHQEDPTGDARGDASYWKSMVYADFDYDQHR